MQKINLKSIEFLPNKDYVLIQPELQEQVEKSESGIVIQMRKNMLDSRPCSGFIVASGDDGYKKNDYVIFPSTDGIDIEMTDGKFLLLKINSIIGKKN